MLEFDNTPTVYWILGYLFTGIVLIAGFSKKLPDTIFVICGLLLLIIMRLPAIVLNRELNPDESQMLSHAITLFQDPLYWKSVDGTTIGPLDNYFLVLPKVFGFQINYTSGRVMGLIATLLSLTFLFLSIRNWSTDKLARALWLVPVFFLAFTQEPDFVHYSSEQVPILLLSLAIWLLSRFTTKNNIRNFNVYVLGLALGAIPFAKLQVVPLAVVVGLFAVWKGYSLFRQGKTPLSLLTLTVGVLTFPFLVLIWASYYDVLQDLVDFYIKGNAIYAGGNEKSMVGQFIHLVSLSPDFIAFCAILLIGGILAIPAAFTKKKNGTKHGAIVNIVFPVVLVLASVYSITKSGNDFIHYLNLCIIPFTLLALPIWSYLNVRVAFLTPLLISGWFFLNDAYLYKNEHILNRFVSTGARGLHQSLIVQELKKYTKPNDYMVVWGWQCAYYVEAQLAQGTAENHSERCIYQHKMRQTYRNRYMTDIIRNRPAIIVDAVGKNSFWVQDINTQGISSFPELSKYVRDNYDFEGDLDGSKLYIRKDRM